MTCLSAKSELESCRANCLINASPFASTQTDGGNLMQQINPKRRSQAKKWEDWEQHVTPCFCWARLYLFEDIRHCDCEWFIKSNVFFNSKRSLIYIIKSLGIKKHCLDRIHEKSFHFRYWINVYLEQALTFNNCLREQALTNNSLIAFTKYSENGLTAECWRQNGCSREIAPPAC